LAIFAPLYNRSGYGVTARALVSALHSAGMKIKTIPVDNVEDGIDDCDMEWLKSLEKTPVTLPVVAIFFHVPSPQWLKVALPPQSIRILFTTFDSSAQGNLPPAEWIHICQQMDQVWLMTEKEATVFATAGVPRSQIHVLKAPHPWINNPALPPAKTSPSAAGKRFRFLCVSMFLPRRRWETLIEAFLTEFKDTLDVELCLKVNYPSWHPVPGQPQRDLRQLIERLRASTGSKAEVILDESLDTRLGICRLIDSCDAYVSTDTSITAPVAEAFVRNKIAIIPDGYGVTLPYCEGTLVIPVDPKLTQPMTEPMLAYQPHHRGKQMPLLRVADVRQTLRAAYELPEPERLRMGHLASLTMECVYGASVATPHFLKAIDVALREKFSPTKPGAGQSPLSGQRVKVDWIGSFLDFGSLSHVNRELARALADGEEVRLLCVNSTGVSDSSMIPKELRQLASGLSGRPSADSQITVRHSWPPDWKRPHSGKLVVIQPWEFGSLPQVWVAQAKNVDEFWVPSEYVRRVYVESGVPAEKVTVVPNGIDPERFRAKVPPMKLATEKKFKFLFVGGTIFRKGPDLLLKAFLDNFTAADDVCLVIKDFGGKTVYAGQTFESQINAAKSQPNAPEILYLNEELPPESLPGLYSACDTFVLPYRGEGFGLPVLEAMACGLPVIVTAGGATDDFVRDAFAWRIPATRLNFGDEVSGLKLVNPGWLLNPDPAALGRFLREAFANPGETHKRGQLAAAHARQSYSWKSAATIAAQRIHELERTGPSAARDSKSNLTARKTPPAVAVKINLPPCALAGQLAEARELIRQKNLRAAWQSALSAISQRPFHPEAWLLLAEIANTAGDGQSAKLCAQHARCLAPNWKPARKFLNQRHKGGARPEWLKLPEEALNQKPKTPGLTVCMIVKNEEKFLGQCLQSVLCLATQIVVVDTGSTDRTMDIAKEHGADVHHFTWCDDFSAARNAALQHATGDWILSLDADEELLPEHHATIRKEMQAAEVMAYRLPIIDKGREQNGCSYVPRLFRNAPGLFFLGRVHEQAFSSIQVRCQEWGLKHVFGKSALLHHGYTREITTDRNKIERNLRLLERAIEELPGEPNLLMNLGLELMRSGKTEAGLERYWEAVDCAAARPAEQVTPELRETLLTQLTAHLATAKLFAEIVKLWQMPFAKSGPVTASQHFQRGLAHLQLQQPAEAAEQMRQCLAKRGQPALCPINPEILKAAPQHCLGLALAALGDFPAAGQAFHAALADDPASRSARFDYAKFHAQRGVPVEALKLLNALGEEKSDDLPVWQLGGQIALSRPEFLEFAQHWTAEAVKHFPNHPAILALRAEALLLSGQAESALPFWLQSHSPCSARHLAALTLCEVLAGECQRKFPPADEKVVSQEFLKWYQQLIKFGAHSLASALNENLDDLGAPLPTAAGLLKAAMKQAGEALAA
jgi:glycosyltransferase involved in cell wall biosynthesis/tetratricopeptide (TPR) repeat protein